MKLSKEDLAARAAQVDGPVLFVPTDAHYNARSIEPGASPKPQWGSGLIVQIRPMGGRKTSIREARSIIEASARYGKLTEAEITDMLLSDGETLLRLKQAAARVQILAAVEA